VELSIKERRRLLSICRGWARTRPIDAVYYLAAPPAARAVERAVGELRAEDRITVLPLDGVARLGLGSGGEVSDDAGRTSLVAGR
jgi:hypothetical protein